MGLFREDERKDAWKQHDYWKVVLGLFGSNRHVLFDPCH